MKKKLIVYSTTDGQTFCICKRIKDILDQNALVELVALPESLGKDLAKYDQIILGASIRYGKHNPSVHRFVETNREVLEAKRTAFFTVNVVARKQNKNSPETNPYLRKFLDATSWKPDLLGVFAGKIDYPKYGFWDKQIIRLIMLITKGPTDTSKTFEFTDWQMVDEFAHKING
tara:strand:- start:119 stop:640 length:522 start_codon:yes stop_codon:yes gene_type:complete